MTMLAAVAALAMAAAAQSPGGCSAAHAAMPCGCVMAVFIGQ